jgi:uncharacterized protein
MSRSACDPATTPPLNGSIVFAPPADLPDIPPASPNGRVFYENLGIRIDRDGHWHYHGSPIRRKELVCLFASALVRDSKGGYWLVTPAEIGRIEVEDTPFLAVQLFKAGQGERQWISFRTNVDEIVTVDDAHPIIISHLPEGREPAPHVMLDRGLEARLSRPVYYELVSLGEETEIAGRKCLAIWSGGGRFPLGWLDEAS